MVEDQKISVIIPVYNKEKYISRCLDSVIGQTYKNLEIILIDDGSTDASLLICRQYEKKDPRIRVFTKPNGGVSSARNCGLEHCTGELIAFVDPDDWLELNCLQRLEQCIEEYNVQIAYGFARDISEKYHTSRTISHGSGTIFVFESRAFNWIDPNVEYSVVWGALYKRKMLQGLKFSEDITVGEDTLFFAQAVDRAVQLTRIDLPLYNYSLNDDSATAGEWRASKMSDLEARQRIKRLYQDDPALYPAARAGCAMICMGMTSKYCDDAVFMKEAFAVCRQAFKSDAMALLKTSLRQKRPGLLCKTLLFWWTPDLYVALCRCRHAHRKRQNSTAM